jgi:hypothetical protein
MGQNKKAGPAKMVCLPTEYQNQEKQAKVQPNPASPFPVNIAGP